MSTTRTRPRANAAQHAWLAGYAVALAEVHRTNGNSTGVVEVARTAGLTLAKAKRAGVDAFDLDELREAGVP